MRSGAACNCCIWHGNGRCAYHGVPVPKSLEDQAEEPQPGMVGCEPYANGRGWWHVPGCPHVDWGEDAGAGAGVGGAVLMAGKDEEDEARARFQEFVKASPGAQPAVLAAFEETFLAGWSAAASYHEHFEDHGLPASWPECRYCQPAMEAEVT